MKQISKSLLTLTGAAIVCISGWALVVYIFMYFTGRI